MSADVTLTSPVVCVLVFSVNRIVKYSEAPPAFTGRASPSSTLPSASYALVASPHLHMLTGYDGTSSISSWMVGWCSPLDSLYVSIILVIMFRWLVKKSWPDILTCFK